MKNEKELSYLLQWTADEITRLIRLKNSQCARKIQRFWRKRRTLPKSKESKVFDPFKFRHLCDDFKAELSEDCGQSAHCKLYLPDIHEISEKRGDATAVRLVGRDEEWKQRRQKLINR